MHSIYAFSKRIKDQKVVHHEISDAEDMAKINISWERIPLCSAGLTRTVHKLSHSISKFTPTAYWQMRGSVNGI